MNDGTLLIAPNALASGTWGLSLGLLPPTAGWVWHPAQLSRLKRGPRPSATVSGSAKSSRPASKNAFCVALRPFSGLPAAPGSTRTPGSLATNWPVAEPAVSSTTTAIVKPARVRIDFLSSGKRFILEWLLTRGGPTGNGDATRREGFASQRIRARRRKHHSGDRHAAIGYDTWGVTRVTSSTSCRDENGINFLRRSPARLLACAADGKIAEGGGRDERAERTGQGRRAANGRVVRHVALAVRCLARRHARPRQARHAQETFSQRSRAVEGRRRVLDLDARRPRSL